MVKGRTVDFRNAVIIMTSNVGANLISRDTNSASLQATLKNTTTKE